MVHGCLMDGSRKMLERCEIVLGALRQSGRYVVIDEL